MRKLFLLLIGICAVGVLILQAEDKYLVRIKGEFLAYSYDLNVVYGEMVSIDIPGYFITAKTLKINISSNIYYAGGDVVVEWEGGKIPADELVFDPKEKSGTVFIYDQTIISYNVGKGDRIYTAKRKDLEKITVENIKKSFVSFTGRHMDLKADLSLIGYDITLFMAGLRSLGFKKHTLTEGPKLGIAGFTLDKIWFSKSEGLVTKAGFRYEKSQKLNSTTQLRYEERSLLKDNTGLDRQFLVMSSTTFSLRDDMRLSLTGNYNSSSLWNAGFLIDKSWKERVQTQLNFSYNKPVNIDGEAWFGLSSSINGGKYGTVAVSGKVELKNQVMAGLSYAAQLLKNVNLVLTGSYARIKIGQSESYSKLFTGTGGLSYGSKLFNLSTAYSLNIDLAGEQVLSQPQLRLSLNPVTFYGGLLTASLSNNFIYNKLKKDVESEDAYSNNTSFSLGTKAFHLWKGMELNVNLSLEQFLEKEGRNFTSGGIITRFQQSLFKGFQLEGFYSYQSRRRTRGWLIEGTMSEDVSLILKVNPFDRLSGWTSVSYDPKNNQFRQSYLNLSLEFIRKWKFHTLVNYDFLLNKLNNIDVYLIREAGRFQLRFIYRSLSKQFLVELVPR
ncbi:MAG: hypothetical protein JXB26_05270 [Candidatus Aminicenantes bacterium]|nr:hypothetical protein [Candidatus Aminicenantes bacterium]